MYSGVGQQGAMDAAYIVMTEVEGLATDRTAYCGGVADIHKLFDQIVRLLVYIVFRLAGMPRGLLDA